MKNRLQIFLFLLFLPIFIPAQSIIKMPTVGSSVRQVHASTAPKNIFWSKEQHNYLSKHLFTPHLKEHINGDNKTATLNGLHHDYTNMLERAGIIRLFNKRYCDHGFYKADVWFDGALTKGKTFFPSSWSQDDVLQTIEKFFRHHKDSVLRIEDRLKIESFLYGAIGLRIILSSQKFIITAYPIINR